MQDFVAEGSPSGWYQHPQSGVDYFYTGRGFGSVDGERIRRRHPVDNPPFVPGTNADAAAWVRENGVDSVQVDLRRVVTTDTLPGHRIVEVMGVVSELTSASGWTASTKGNIALTSALSGLLEAAMDMGANAIVGLHVATFGAHGGITSGFGGDAVGVLLMGTAVRAAPEIG
ncbi:MAG: hypothetical protein U0R65_15785 [Candidatus Nanopelagicales bacterium]